LYGERALKELAPLLAQHYFAAGDPTKTTIYAERAGDHAAKVYANAEAIEHYSVALNAAAQTLDSRATLISLYLKRGRAFELMAKYDAALSNYAEMESHALAEYDPKMELAAGMASATIYSTPNQNFDPVKAQELSARNLSLARELKDAQAEAKIQWTLLLMAQYSGRTLDAIGYGERSIALARAQDMREQLAFALNDISRPYLLQGDYAKSLNALREANELWHALDNQPMLADNLNTQATLLYAAGDYDRTLVRAQEAYRLAREIENPWAQAHSLMAQSFVYADCGDVENSLRVMHESLEIGERIGFLFASLTMRIGLALAYAGMGDAATAFEGLREMGITSNSERAETYVSSTLARLWIQQGDLSQARTFVARSNQYLDKAAPSPFVSGFAFVADLELALAENENERAFELARKLGDMKREIGTRFMRPDATFLCARALDVSGHTEQALQILQEFETEAEALGVRRNLWRILSLHAEIESRRGNTERARALSSHARQVLDYIAAHTPESHRTRFVNLPEVQAVYQRADSFASQDTRVQ
jgi:ATP/maltotriose-dependent transcriptional regulator MalT